MRSPSNGATISSRSWTRPKYYFLKADVEEFKKEATEPRRPDARGKHRLRQQGLRPVLGSGTTSGSRPCWNCSSRSTTSRLDEYLSDDPDKIDYPVDKAEADERLRKKVKFDLLYLQGRRRR